MKELQRIKVGDFSITNAININEILENKNLKQILEDKIITIEELFKNCKELSLENRKLELFLNGVKLTYKLNDGIYRIYNSDKFIGLGIVENELLKRDIVL